MAWTEQTSGYVIASHLRPEAYVHELVYVRLDALLEAGASIISGRRHLLDAKPDHRRPAQINRYRGYN